jgi:hypothetical protein
MNSIKDVGNAMIWPTAWMLVGSRVLRLVHRQEAVRSPAARTGDAGRSRALQTPTTTGFGPSASVADPAEPAPKLQGIGK